MIRKRLKPQFELIMRLGGKIPKFIKNGKIELNTKS